MSFSFLQDDARDIFGNASTTYEALEAISRRNSVQYVNCTKKLSQPGFAYLAAAVLKVSCDLAPSGTCFSVFGSTRAPALLLFAPALLLRAVAFFASSSLPSMCGAGAEWNAVSTFILATYNELLASPRQHVAQVTALPSPQASSHARHSVMWSALFTPAVLAEIAQSSSSIFGRLETLDTANFGTVLYVITCGWAHLMKAITTFPAGVFLGAGTLELIETVISLFFLPTVIIYGSKALNLQMASAALFVAMREVIALREEAGEVKQKLLIDRWAKCVQCWFDVAVQSDNALCVHFLTPHMFFSEV